MAKDRTKGSGDKSGTFSKDVKVEDIHTAAASLADAKDHALGYDNTMQHHINRGGDGARKTRGD